ncbi:hypothetical protein K2P56_03925 [Patescibacteria group bacterium]|nr:hypothetical protein [Patescibacteria group bacterium]
MSRREDLRRDVQVVSVLTGATLENVEAMHWRTVDAVLARTVGQKTDGASWGARHPGSQPVTSFTEQARPVSTRKIKRENEEEAEAALARLSAREPGSRDWARSVGAPFQGEAGIARSED